jgi:hypothetical protein
METRLFWRAMLFATALAVVTRYGDHLPGHFEWLRKVGVPWLAVAFAAATGVRRIRTGALLGAFTLVVAIAAYYALLAFVQGAYDRSPVGVGWFWIAVPAGAAFGALGARWSQGEERVLIAALMTACFAGEALLFRGLVDARATPYLLTAAAVMPLVLVSRPADRLRALALAGPLVGVAVLSEVYVFLTTGYFASRLF